MTTVRTGDWLLAIVFIPFSMDILSSASDTQFPNSAVYVGTLLVATTALFDEYAMVFLTPALQEDDVNLKPCLIAAAVDTLAVLEAFVLTLTSPQWGLQPLLLLIVSGFIGRYFGRRFSARPTGDPDVDDE